MDARSIKCVKTPLNLSHLLEMCKNYSFIQINIKYILWRFHISKHKRYFKRNSLIFNPFRKRVIKNVGKLAILRNLHKKVIAFIDSIFR